MMWANLRGLRPARGAAALLIASGAHAQDFPDTQAMANRVLFAAQDAAQERRAAEQRRVDDLAQRADRQAVLLQTQAASMQQLGAELQSIREERRLTDLADAFDASLVGRRWALARTYLAETVAIDLDGQPGSIGTVMSADSLIASLPALIANGGVLPRSDQQVRFEAEHATLSSKGFAWVPTRGSRAAPNRQAGRYEYGFRRTADGWQIDSLAFHPIPAE